MNKARVILFYFLGICFGVLLGVVGTFKYADGLTQKLRQADRVASPLLAAGALAGAVETLEDLNAGHTNDARAKLEWQLKFHLDLLEKTLAREGSRADARLIEARDRARAYLKVHPVESKLNERN